ncbi:hypothetical protein GO755_02495 [Spirosoma sp. HMF4905]|uniref:Uncharacterized protein n=1 Tax=Spirosoma arboris TaxID=2682092 RepID=A0A7K1S5G7_9BACT|nr:hypothetical protein [Spirosoma arboris]MVM28886.1 hypothetical protein [Spirosoma arboris]
MKHILVIALCLLSLHVVGQSVANKVDLHTWKPPYTLIIPTGWTSERFSIPIEFAPQIPYKGVEEVRFAPGWDKRSSADYWSYAYLWWLEGKPAITAADLQENLKAYYTGLIAQNSANRTMLASKSVPTTTLIKKVKTTSDGVDVYSGTIKMLDYMGQSAITLNCQIHVKNCKEQKRTAVLVEASPKPTDHAIWKTLDSIQQNFTCTK